VTLLQAVVLGIVQGLTEFLPISSDGHLAVTYHLFGTAPNLAYEVFLHGATLIAMFVYFWRDVLRLLASLLPSSSGPERAADRRLVALIAIGTVISAVIALALGDVIEPLAASMTAVGIGFLVTTAFLVIAEVVDRPGPALSSPAKLGYIPLAVIAVLQGIAALPGVSRSGSTIAGGMFFRLSRADAARFSFLLGIPIITLATLKDALDVAQGAAHLPGTTLALAAGFVAAGVAGYFAIWGLLRFVKNHSLYWFAAYTGVLGTAMLLSGTVFGRG
jgi:undecaprenyl-diphosphatase